MKKLFVIALFAFLSISQTAFSAECFATKESGIVIPVGSPEKYEHDFCVGNTIHIAWDKSTKNPFWVAEYLTKEEVTGTAKRQAGWKFKTNSLLVGLAPKHTDYNDATLDGEMLARGHMAPAEDHQRNDAAMLSTFDTANIVPQVQSCNNSGVWRSIEEKVHDWTLKYGKVFVATGPGYEGSPKTLKSGIAIPAFMWKAVYVPSLNQSVSFIVPNKPLCGKAPKDMVVSEKTLITKTGLKPFPSVPQHSDGKLF